MTSGGRRGKGAGSMAGGGYRVGSAHCGTGRCSWESRRDGELSLVVQLAFMMAMSGDTGPAEPQSWQVWALRLLVATVIAALLAAAYRLRVRQLLELERLRLRIAADLHDDVGSNLSSIALLSEMLRGRLTRDEVDQRQLMRITAAAEETIGALRDIIWLVNPSHAAVDDLIRKMRVVAADLLNGTQVTFEVEDPPERPIGMDFMRAALLVYKEALHNVCRHAAASSVRVRIRMAARHLEFCIEDDGVGFDVDARVGGYGVENMRRRAWQAGGAVDIMSARGEGTRVTFRAPLA
jgi:signal transduction histidine kinase